MSSRCTKRNNKRSRRPGQVEEARIFEGVATFAFTYVQASLPSQVAIKQPDVVPKILQPRALCEDSFKDVLHLHAANTTSVKMPHTTYLEIDSQCQTHITAQAAQRVSRRLRPIPSASIAALFTLGLSLGTEIQGSNSKVSAMKLLI